MTHHIRIKVVPTKKANRDYRKLARALLLLVEQPKSTSPPENPEPQAVSERDP